MTEGEGMETSAKTDMVYQAIFKDIIRNVYDDNSILTEKMLIDKYNVSRSPVREALLRLCSEDILQSVPRMGYRVTPVSLKNLLDAGALRMTIELSALDMYFPTLSEQQINTLEELYRRGEEIENERDVYLHWKMNKVFHLTLCSFSGNSYYTKILEQLMKACFRGASQYYGESWQQGLHREDMRWHRKLLDALHDRDQEKAREILTSDIDDYLSAFRGVRSFLVPGCSQGLHAGQ